ncbi:hypothetical protein [Gymnodinialimonas hymeniacidonis]|uniref:hypothetical protein n=1 Tax=Gymnodinialimonas hymeniacidonis TaxID=3126508 RepID=UPI0034C60434
MSDRPPCRLSIYFASEKPRAVILRRGPTRNVCMIEWNTKTDTFKDGQWVKHRVYEEKCDLSTDSKHFAYFGFSDHQSHGQMTGGFAAVSEVPYFTALAILVEGSTWGHGGRFVDRHHVLCPYLHNDGVPPLPAPLRWVWHPNAFGVARDQAPPSRDVRPTHFVLSSGKAASIQPAALKRFLEAWPPVPKAPVLPKWCTVEDGCLYRIGPKGRRILLKDFNAMEFEAIEAPYSGVVI